MLLCGGELTMHHDHLIRQGRSGVKVVFAYEGDRSLSQEERGGCDPARQAGGQAEVQAEVV